MNYRKALLLLMAVIAIMLITAWLKVSTAVPIFSTLCGLMVTICCAVCLAAFWGGIGLPYKCTRHWRLLQKDGPPHKKLYRARLLDALQYQGCWLLVLEDREHIVHCRLKADRHFPDFSKRVGEYLSLELSADHDRDSWLRCGDQCFITSRYPTGLRSPGC